MKKLITLALQTYCKTKNFDTIYEDKDSPYWTIDKPEECVNEREPSQIKLLSDDIFRNCLLKSIEENLKEILSSNKSLEFYIGESINREVKEQFIKKIEKDVMSLTYDISEVNSDNGTEKNKDRDEQRVEALGLEVSYIQKIIS